MIIYLFLISSVKFGNALLSENAYWGVGAVPRLYDIVIKEKTTLNNRLILEEFGKF